MLVGEHETKLTDKNRVALPKEFRDVLGPEIVITKGYEGCLIITSKQDFANFTTPLREGPFLSKAVRDTTRFLVGSAHNAELDSQGRFVLPKPLLEYAGINKAAVFAGLHKWIELWDETKWKERMREVETNASDIAESLVAKEEE